MKVMFIFAHPDDESFSSAGTISKLTKQGVDVRLVTATRGEEGQFGIPPVATKENIGEVREKELLCAAGILGISKVYFLPFHDSSLNKLPKGKISRKITPILKKEQPDVVITFNEEGGSLHPDHVQINKSATEAFLDYMKDAKKHVRLYYSSMPRSFVEELKKKGLTYNIYGEIKGTKDSLISTVIDISETIKDKINALKCHRTQNKDWQRYLKRLEKTKIKKEYFRLIKENYII